MIVRNILSKITYIYIRSHNSLTYENTDIIVTYISAWDSV